MYLHFTIQMSFYDIAFQYKLSYDALFARYKPYACINPLRNELVLFNEQLEKEKTTKIPFDTGNVITFALTYKYGVFIEENKLCVWEFETTERVAESYREFSYKARAIFHRHEFLFMVGCGPVSVATKAPRWLGESGWRRLRDRAKSAVHAARRHGHAGTLISVSERLDGAVDPSPVVIGSRRPGRALVLLRAAGP